MPNVFITSSSVCISLHINNLDVVNILVDAVLETGSDHF